MGVKYTTQTYTCEHCGKEYRAAYNARHKFCCRACQKAATAKKRERVCKTCGVVFVRGHGAQGYYCSYDCYWKALQGRRPHNYDPDIVECAVCGKSFKVIRARLGHAAFCSVACMAKSKEKPRITKTCPTCGKDFSVWPSQSRLRYCSHECHGKDNRGERSPHWKGGRYPYYGTNWRDQCKEARERDGYRCQVCGIHERKLTYRLHVHHIIPRREFNGDLERANNLDNLICLCRSCHRKAERESIPVQPKLI